MKHKIGAYSLATAMLLMGAAPASAGIINIFDGSSLADIDATGGASTTLTITDTGSIMDLDVALAINNPDPFITDFASISDMNIILSHGGVDVTLFNSTGNGDFGFMDIVFDDEAPDEVDEGDADTWTGFWQPHEALSAFDNMDISGDWTLSFMDNFFEDEGDELLSWSLIAELPEQDGGGDPDGGTNPIPVPSTVLLFGLGMAALGLRRQNS